MSKISLDFFDNKNGDWNIGSIFRMKIKKEDLEKILTEVFIKKIMSIQKKFNAPEYTLTVEQIVEQNSLPMNFLLYKEAIRRGCELEVEKLSDIDVSEYIPFA